MNFAQFLDAAAKRLRAKPAQVEAILRSAPYRYRHYTIPKRSGGVRDIFHPTPALKSIQRWMIEEPLSALPVHEAVYSYVREKSIGMNASAHVTSNYFVRYDFKDFFPSISSGVLSRFLRSSVENGIIDLDSKSLDSVVRLACCASKVTHALALSIGAPSSPFLSNAVMFGFDEALFEEARASGVVYTRYADDIFLSSQGIAALDSFEYKFRRLVAEVLPFVRINEEKVQHFSRKRRVTITGVNVTSARSISVGRDLKRSVRTRLFLALSGRLSPAEHSSLRGTIAYIMGIEPGFYASLANKFGRGELEKFMKFASAQ